MKVIHRRKRPNLIKTKAYLIKLSLCTSQYSTKSVNPKIHNAHLFLWTIKGHLLHRGRCSAALVCFLWKSFLKQHLPKLRFPDVSVDLISAVPKQFISRETACSTGGGLDGPGGQDGPRWTLCDPWLHPFVASAREVIRWTLMSPARERSMSNHMTSHSDRRLSSHLDHKQTEDS